jgi:DNA-binding LacI/PurR family transcriptional regulator
MKIQKKTGKIPYIANSIREAIHSGAYPPGSYLPSAVKLAQSYQVAKETVNAALSILVGENLITRSRKRGTSVLPPPNLPHNNGQRGIGIYMKTPMIEVLKISDEHSAWLELFSGLTHTIAERGYFPVMLNAVRGDDDYGLVNPQLAGVILPGGEPDVALPLLVLSEKHDLPCIMINRPLALKCINCIEEYSEREVTAAVRSLLASGMRRIAAIGSGLDWELYRKFEQAYRNAMGEYGCYNPARYWKLPGLNPEPADCDAALDALLAGAERPELLLIMSSSWNIQSQVFHALERRAVRWPEELALATFSSGPVNFRGRPVLTFGGNSKTEFAERLVHQLIDQIEGKMPMPYLGEMKIRRVF